MKGRLISHPKGPSHVCDPPWIIHDFDGQPSPDAPLDAIYVCSCGRRWVNKLNTWGGSTPTSLWQPEGRWSRWVKALFDGSES